MQAFLIGQFLPLLVLVPVLGAMALVTTSIVDELHGRSLEPLLATPITTLELLVAKAGSAFIVSLVLLAAGCLLMALVTAALASPGVLAALVTPRAIAILGGLAPAAAAAALMLGVVASSRAKDARTAQQFSRADRAAAGGALHQPARRRRRGRRDDGRCWRGPQPGGSSPWSSRWSACGCSIASGS